MLPEALLDRLDAQELRGILAHEAAHRSRRDLVRLRVGWWATLLFWFYPPLWMLRARLRRSAEEACDDAALDAGVPPDAFGRALARVLHTGLVTIPASASLGAHGDPTLRARLRRLRDLPRRKVMLRHRFAIALAVVTVVLSVHPWFEIEAGQDLPRAPEPAARPESAVAPAPAPAEAPPTAPEPVARPAAMRSPSPASPAVPAAPWAVQHQGSLSDLEGAQRRLDIDFTDAAVGDVLGFIADVGGFEIQHDSGALDRLVTVRLADTTVVDALEVVAVEGDLWYEVRDSSALVVFELARVGGDLEAPTLQHRVNPVYPDEARREGVSGVVVLDVVVSEDGSVVDVKTVKSPSVLLTQAAIDAVREWRYEPSLLDGDPVKVKAVITVSFKLR